MAELTGASLAALYVLPLISGEHGGSAETARRALVDWARDEVGVTLDASSALVEAGDPASCLLAAAQRRQSDLVVIGRCGAEAGCGVMSRLVQSLSHRLLIAASARDRSELIAATDMLDPSFPIVHSAALLADRLSARVTVVHNVEQEGRVASMPPTVLRDRLDELERLARALDTVQGAQVGVTPTTIEAIAALAAARDADLVIVGVRSGGGSTFERLVSHVPGRSVLAVPLAPFEDAA